MKLKQLEEMPKDQQFVAETEQDKEIEAEYYQILNSEEEDGRIFRDTVYNYSVLFSMVDEELMKDYNTLCEYYD